MSDVTLTIIVSTLTIFLFIGLVVILLVLNQQRRTRHRADLAELKLTHDREVMDAEREAQRQTLQEVGRELHDNLGQLLTVVQMGLYAELEDDGKKQRIHEAVNTLELSIEEVRRMGRSLNSDMWEQRTITEAITAEAERIERMGLAKVHLLVQGEPPDLSPDAKTILFRVFQEVVNNALKHAGADSIDVSLTDGATPTLTITDNGRGFDQEKAKTGSGTVNIRRRCEMIGFVAELHTAPGQGTTWRITRNGHGA